MMTKRKKWETERNNQDQEEARGLGLPLTKEFMSQETGWLAQGGSIGHNKTPSSMCPLKKYCVHAHVHADVHTCVRC